MLFSQFVNAKIIANIVKSIVIGVKTFLSNLFLENTFPSVLSKNNSDINHKAEVIRFLGLSTFKMFARTKINTNKNILIKIETIS